MSDFVQEEQAMLDQQRLDDVRRQFTIIDIPEKHILRANGIERVRIYDSSVYAIQSAGNNAYSNRRWELMREKTVPTMMVAKKLFAESGDWTEEDELREENLSQQADDLNERRDYIIARRDAAKTDKEREKAEKELAAFDLKHQAIFSEYTNLLAVKFALFSDTVEWQARESRQLTLLVMSLCKDEGEDRYDPQQRLFRSVDSLMQTMQQRDIQFLLVLANKYWDIRKGVGDIPFFGESPAPEAQE